MSGCGEPSGVRRLLRARPRVAHQALVDVEVTDLEHLAARPVRSAYDRTQRCRRRGARRRASGRKAARSRPWCGGCAARVACRTRPASSRIAASRPRERLVAAGMLGEAEPCGVGAGVPRGRRRGARSTWPCPCAASRSQAASTSAAGSATGPSGSTATGQVRLRPRSGRAASSGVPRDEVSPTGRGRARHHRRNRSVPARSPRTASNIASPELPAPPAWRGRAHARDVLRGRSRGHCRFARREDRRRTLPGGLRGTALGPPAARHAAS